MTKIHFECRIEQRLTVQIVVKVTDILPGNVHVLECTGCGNLRVALVDIDTACLA